MYTPLKLEVKQLAPEEIIVERHFFCFGLVIFQEAMLKFGGGVYTNEWWNFHYFYALGHVFSEPSKLITNWYMT